MSPVIEAESENDAVSRIRATLLLFMLASDERESILTLARSLAIARHGHEEVQRHMVTGDLMTGLMRGMAEATPEAFLSKKPIDTEKFAPSLDAFMNRQGHIPDPKKLPEK